MTSEKSVEMTIKCDIARGVYEVGREIPSISELAKCQNVSDTPVKNALLRLKKQGIVVYRPGKKFIVNDNADKQCRSEIAEIAKELITDIITLAISANIMSNEFHDYFSKTENEIINSVMDIVMDKLSN